MHVSRYGVVQMKLIIAGSRSITSYSILLSAIVESGIWSNYKRSIEVVSGTARGADRLGEQFAEKNALKLFKKPAEWDKWRVAGANVQVRNGKKYNALAGHWRNEEMAEMADQALILWDGTSTGSLDMMNRMLAHGKPVYLYPMKMDVDLYDELTKKGVVIILPKGLDTNTDK